MDNKTIVILFKAKQSMYFNIITFGLSSLKVDKGFFLKYKDGVHSVCRK